MKTVKQLRKHSPAVYSFQENGEIFEYGNCKGTYSLKLDWRQRAVSKSIEKTSARVVIYLGVAPLSFDGVIAICCMLGDIMEKVR